MAELKKTNLQSGELVIFSSEKTKTDTIESNESISNLKQKYKDSVLLEIFQMGRIPHSVLSDRILISTSGLTAVIKKLNEARPAPICVDNQGKFRFYSLKKSAEEYVKEELIPSLINDPLDERVILNIFSLLSAFKDKNRKDWLDKLESILSGNVDLDEYEEGIGFIKELEKYYIHSKDGAEKLLDLAVVDKELQKKFKYHLEYYRKNSFKNIWEVMNYWERENTIELYRLVDAFFVSFEKDENCPDFKNFPLTNIETYVEEVWDKIQGVLCRAMMRKLPKEDILHIWMGQGLEVHLALYLADKYRVYCQ